MRGCLALAIRRQRFVWRAARYGFQLLGVTVAANAVRALSVACRSVAVATTIGVGALAPYARQARRGFAARERLASGLEASP